MKDKYVFVGERPSMSARKMRVTRIDGRLAAKPLHEALRAIGIDPRAQTYLNLFHDDRPWRVRRTVMRKLRSLSENGLVIVALGRIVSKHLTSLKIEHKRLIHPAARGRIRKTENYRRHVLERLTQPMTPDGPEVGEMVWYRRKRTGPWQTDWEIVEIKLGRKQDRVRIFRASTKKKQVVSLNKLLTMPKMLPERVRQVLSRYPHLRAFRGCRGYLELICSLCQQKPTVQLRMDEVADLVFQDDVGEFRFTKPEVASSDTSIACGCPGEYAIRMLSYYDYGDVYFEDEEEHATGTGTAEPLKGAT